MVLSCYSLFLGEEGEFVYVAVCLRWFFVVFLSGNLLGGVPLKHLTPRSCCKLVYVVA